MNNQTNFQYKSVLQRFAILCATVFFVSATYAHEQVKTVVIPMAGDDLRTVYEIGKTGPAGGIVFHATDGGLHGLEASHEDQGALVEWGCTSTDLANIVDLPNKGVLDPNTGEHNTQAIIAAGCAVGGAADVASSYMGPNGITTGWYLPNKEELRLLYQAYVNGTVGGFASSFYWSSSENGSLNAWVQLFDIDIGFQTNGTKSATLPVRAVRAF